MQGNTKNYKEIQGNTRLWKEAPGRYWEMERNPKKNGERPPLILVFRCISVYGLVLTLAS